jgi:hypothetical protein
MSTNFIGIAQGVTVGVGLLASPDTANAFRSLVKAATVSKALDTKTKELMALAIGITTHSDGRRPERANRMQRYPKATSARESSDVLAIRAKLSLTAATRF